MQALADRDLLFRAWNVFFEQYPLLVMPVLAKPFMRMNEDLEGPEHMADLWSDLRYTVNLAALAIPSLAFPVGHEDGIPLGVQIATHAWREDRLLAVGDALERTTWQSCRSRPRVVIQSSKLVLLRHGSYI